MPSDAPNATPATSPSRIESEADRLAATQKYQDAVSVYFARKVSRHLTPVFLKLRISANGATAVWGLLSLFNSFVIYVAIAGAYYLVPIIPVIYFLVVVIDCVDGEIARFRGTASPIGGKLLDGVWHKATEYSLLMAYTAGAYYWTGYTWLAHAGMILLAGEAMHTYVYERRLTVIRVFAKSSEYINPTSSDDLYRKDEAWRTFSSRKKLNAFKGLIQYKSVYFLIALSILSTQALLAGFLLLTAYKHFAWIKLLAGVVMNPPKMAADQ